MKVIYSVAKYINENEIWYYVYCENEEGIREWRLALPKNSWNKLDGTKFEFNENTIEHYMYGQNMKLTEPVTYSNPEKSIPPDLIKSIIHEALTIDGEHHKQWYLGILADIFDLENNDDWERGIAP